MKLDPIRFAEAKALAELSSGGGIGTLGERALHRTLKYYIEPDDTLHEQECLGGVADIISDGTVYEIQTRALTRLLPKFERLLPERKVALVYPIAAERVLSWLDEATGEATKPRRISRKGRPSDALLELYPLAPVLTHPNLTVHLFIIKTEEYKLLNGKGASRKKGAERVERIPTELVDIITLATPEDYSRLIPPKLSDPFTAAEFYRAAQIKGRRAYYALKLLCDLGVLAREKQGRTYMYSKTQ